VSTAINIPRKAPPLVGVLATSPLAIQRANYVAALQRLNWNDTSAAGLARRKDLEALRELVDSDYYLWNAHAPAGCCDIPPEDDTYHEGEDDGYPDITGNECPHCHGTGEGPNEHVACSCVSANSPYAPRRPGWDL
jgi:hypothetical protein